MSVFFFLSDIYTEKIKMVVSENSRNPKKKAKRLNSVRGTQRFTRPSQPLGTANVIINTNDAIPKLQQLSQKYIGVNNPHGFLTDLRNALGIPDSSGAISERVIVYRYLLYPLRK